MNWRDVNQEQDEEKISRINSAGLTNITLENLWRECYAAMSKGDMVLLNRKLDAIWINLGGDCEESGDEEKFIKDIDKKIYDLGSLSNKKIGFSSKLTNSPLNTAKQYLLLKQKSLYLRRLQNKQGKGTAYAKQDEDDFD